MKKPPGRPSAAALEAAALAANTTATPTLRAPVSLAKDTQSRVNSLIASKPPGFFQRCDMPLLIEAARQQRWADKIDSDLNLLLKPSDAGAFAALLPMAGTTAARIAALMRALRLTAQSRYRSDSRKTDESEPVDEDAQGNVTRHPRPWEPVTKH